MSETCVSGRRSTATVVVSKSTLPRQLKPPRLPKHTRVSFDTGWVAPSHSEKACNNLSCHTLPAPAERPDTVAKPQRRLSDYDGHEWFLKEMEISSPLLMPEEEQSLIQRKLKGDEEAFETLVKKNMRLVISMALPYSQKVDLRDLISVGLIGLMEAVREYEPEKSNGATLATFARWPIRQHLVDEVRRFGSGQVRVSRSIVADAKKLAATTTELYTLHGKTPTDGMIAKALKWSEEEVREVRSMIPPSYAPLHLPSVGEEGPTVGESLSDERATLPAQHAVQFSDRTLLRRILATGIVSKIQRKVLVERFGLEGNEPRTLEEIGIDFGVTKERIRQIEAEGLKKLKKKYLELGESL